MVSTGGVALIIIVIFIFIAVAIFLIVWFTLPGNTASSSRGVEVVPQASTNGSVADFRPIKLTRCDLKEICDESSSSCGMEDKVHLPGPMHCSEAADISSNSCSLEDSGSDLWQPPSDPCSESCSESCSDICDSIEKHCNEKDYFSSLDQKVVEFCDLNPDQVKDITNIGSLVIALRKSNSTQLVLKQTSGKEHKQCQVKSNLSLDRIISFQGVLLAVSNGRLYQQDPTSVGKKTLYWFQLEKLPEGITWITKTADDSYLWIQTNNGGETGTGYLLNCKLKEVNKINISSEIQRFFGRTIRTIGDLNTRSHELTLVSCNRKFVNIGQAIFNFNNEIIFVRENQTSVVGIRLVLYQPYYLLQ